MNLASLLGPHSTSNVKSRSRRHGRWEPLFQTKQVSFSCWWEQPGTRTGSTLQMIRWRFHQNVEARTVEISSGLAVLLMLIWSGPVGTWAKRLWTSHEQQVCCPLSQFPTYGCIPQRLLSIAISSTDIPTSSEVTLYIIVVLFGRLHFLFSLPFFFYIWTIFCPSDCAVWWFSCFVLTDTHVRDLEQGFKGIVRPKTSCCSERKITFSPLLTKGEHWTGRLFCEITKQKISQLLARNNSVTVLSSYLFKCFFNV